MPKTRTLSFLALAASALFAAFCHFTNLDWGLPSSRRAAQVLGSQEQVHKWAPVMIEQRKRYYSLIGNMLDDKQPFEDGFRKLNRRWEAELFQPLPQDIVLDRMRNYLIGVNVSDEQITMNAIAEINPKKLDFVPGPLAYYGGLYYYTAGAFLVAGKVLGKLSLTPGVEYYFTHPDEVRWMYIIVRMVGGASILASLFLLFFLMRRLYGDGAAAVAALLLVSFPLLVPISHLTKAHLYGMFWITAGTSLCGLTLSDPGRGTGASALAGACLGLSAGTIITNSLTGILLPLTEWMRLDWDPKALLRSRRFWISVLCFALAAGTMNYFIFLNWPEFRRVTLANITYFPAFVTMQLHEWPAYLKSFPAEQVHVLVLPLFFAGAALAAAKKEKFPLLCLLGWAFLFLQNLVTTRHSPVNARLLPFIAILSAWGCREIWGRLQGWNKGAFAAYLAAAVLLSGIQCVFYNKVHRDPSNVDLAGRWINDNVPKGASLGAWGGGFSSFDFPAIRFLDYKMVNIPHPHELDGHSIQAELLPDYLVLNITYRGDAAVFPESRTLERNYREVASWPWQDEFLGLKFQRKSLKTGNWGIKLLARSSAAEN